MDRLAARFPGATRPVLVRACRMAGIVLAAVQVEQPAALLDTAYGGCLRWINELGSRMTKMQVG